LYTNRSYAVTTFTVSASSISSTGAAVASSLSIGDKAVNTVTVRINDATADVFKADNPEAKLKEFLFFYTFNPTELTPTEINAGKTHTLTALSGWSLDRKSGSDTFVLKFPVFTASSSRVVWKIDSTKYTFRDGLKMDLNNNDIAGEAVYDDHYGQIPVDGITYSAATASLPRNVGFNVALSLTSYIPSFTNSTSNNVGFPNFSANAWATATAEETSGANGTADIVILNASNISASFFNCRRHR